jgi:hypothetical protein
MNVWSKLVCLGFVAAAAAGPTVGGALASDCADEKTLKSAAGGSTTEITFANGSSEARRLYWIDDAGARKFQAVIEPGAKYKQPTSVSHHWMVADGNEKCLSIVTAASSPITVEVAGGESLAPPPKGTNVAAPAGVVAPVGAAVAALAPVSPVELYNLKGWHVIRSVARQSYDLNNLATGYPELEPSKPDWFSAHWEFQPVSGTSFVRVKNRWKNTYLVVDRGSLRVTDSGVGSEFAQWSLEPVAGQTYGRIKNRADGRMLVATKSGFDLKSEVTASADSYWYLVPVGGSGGFGTAPAAPQIIERVVEKPSKTVNRDCKKHYTYSKAEGECVKTSSTCDKSEVYSSSLAECVPRSIAGPDKPKKIKGCEEGFKLVDGACVKIKKNAKPAGCPPGTVPVPQTDNCVWKTDKKGFEVAPWKKPECKALQVGCSAGSKTACKKYEETCQVN